MPDSLSPIGWGALPSASRFYCIKARRRLTLGACVLCRSRRRPSCRPSTPGSQSSKTGPDFFNRIRWFSNDRNADSELSSEAVLAFDSFVGTAHERLSGCFRQCEPELRLPTAPYFSEIQTRSDCSRRIVGSAYRSYGRTLSWKYVVKNCRPFLLSGTAA